MLNPYKMVGRALALFKAAGLVVPAYGENEKRRLLDAWVQRYGNVDNEVFAVCSRKLASGQRFPRFYDMDEAVKEELRLRNRQVAADLPASISPPVDHEANKKRLHQLIEHLTRRRGVGEESCEDSRKIGKYSKIKQKLSLSVP